MSSGEIVGQLHQSYLCYLILSCVWDWSFLIQQMELGAGHEKITRAFEGVGH